MSKALAIKYRPTQFADLTEQSAVVTILKNQINTDTIKHGYLFCGGAGTGKTTSARIFANMINNGQGEPIELDAASNNSVDDIRRITEQAQTKSLNSEYKVFILDEVHSLSNQAWQAMLKTLEEPPAKSIFIFCTTNPEKIPATILSRVQRYNFQRISQKGIVERLFHILECENEEIASNGSQDAVHDYTWAKEEGLPIIEWEAPAIEYIAKVADGGMRDAITLMDKCLSYSRDLTLDNVVKALGVADYETMFHLNDAIFMKNKPEILNIINTVYTSGMDIKQFIKNYFEFILDLNTYCLTNDLGMTKIPDNKKDEIHSYGEYEWDEIFRLLEFVTNLQSSIKWEQNAKAVVIAKLIIFVGD